MARKSILAREVKRRKVVDVSNKGNVTLLDYDCGCPTKGSRSC